MKQLIVGAALVLSCGALSAEEDAAAIVQQMRDAYAAGQTSFTVPPGVYRFGRNQSYWRIEWNSRPFTVDAKGATFLFDPAMAGLRIEKSANVTIRGLEVGFDPPKYSQGKLLSLDAATKTARVQLDAGYPVLDATWSGEKVIFYDPAGQLQRVMRMDWIKEVRPQAGSARGEEDTALPPPASRLAPVVDIVFQNGFLWDHYSEVAIGDRVALPNRKGQHAIVVDHSANIRLEDVVIRHGANMGISENGGEGRHRYERVRIERPAGRLLATNADGFHSAEVAYGPTLSECVFEHTGDDLVNIHGCTSLVVAQESPTTVIVVDHFVQDLERAQSIGFYGWSDLALLGQAPVLSVVEAPEYLAEAKNVPAYLRSLGHEVVNFHATNVWAYRVRLGIPIGVNKGDIADTQTAGLFSNITNCRFAHGFARGVVIRGAQSMVARNEISHVGGNAVEMSLQPYWLEGPMCRGITIEDNVISDANRHIHGQLPQAFSGLAVYSGDDRLLRGSRHHRRLSIQGNTIFQSGATGILACNLADSSIKGNTIYNPWTAPAKLATGSSVGVSAKQGVWIMEAENVDVSDNVTYASSAQGGMP